jgi:hypothetical protein
MHFVVANTAVDFIKLDCMWPNLYEGTPQVYFNEDVVAEAGAFAAAGLAVSLSPGISVSPLNGSFLSTHGLATMYRIAEDVLDIYDSNLTEGELPVSSHLGVRCYCYFQHVVS